MVVSEKIELRKLYTNLGVILRYPHEDVRPLVGDCIDIVTRGNYPEEVIRELNSFKKDVDRLTLESLQELYSYTFELTSETTLDMGYYVLEGFKRARNLLTIKTMYREQGFPYDEIAKGELPDNLSVILQFVGYLDNEVLKKNFVKSYVIQAMEKLDRNFQARKNAYKHLINAIYKILDRDIKDEKEVS